MPLFSAEPNPSVDACVAGAYVKPITRLRVLRPFDVPAE